MTFTEDHTIDTIETHSPDWDKIEASLSLIDPSKKSFFVLTNESGSYIQSAGGRDRLVIEWREFENPNVFKHFVLGRVANKSPLKTVWTTVDCKVGPISIHDDEVLTLEDAIDLFRVFFYNEKMSSAYKKRNVTKTFLNI